MRLSVGPARIGGYAAITSRYHAPVLERAFIPREKCPETVWRWQQWLDEHDAALVVLHPGVRWATEAAQQAMQKVKSQTARLSKQWQAEAEVFDVYGRLFQTAEKEVVACGVGVQLDRHNTLRIVSRTLLTPGGRWGALLGQGPPPTSDLLAGLPAGPFVLAGGAAPSQAVWKAMTDFGFDCIKSVPRVYGLTPEQADKLASATEQTMKGCRSAAIMLGPGEGNAPIYAGMIGAMRVDDSKAVITADEKGVGAYAEVLKQPRAPCCRCPKLRGARSPASPPCGRR